MEHFFKKNSSTTFSIHRRNFETIPACKYVSIYIQLTVLRKLVSLLNMKTFFGNISDTTHLSKILQQIPWGLL